MRDIIQKIVSPFIPETGLVVVEASSTEDVLVVFSTGAVKEYSEGKYREWDTLPEEAQFFWYVHVVDNAQLIQHYLRENVVEFDAEFLERGNAQEITGADKTVIGHLIDVGTEDGDTEVHSLMFHSPDGTFATLTAWIPTEQGSRETAGKDLLQIIDGLTNYYNTHFKDEEKVE